MQVHAYAFSASQPFSPFHVKAIICNKLGNASDESRSVRKCWVWCVPSWFKVCLQEETLQTRTSQRTDIRIRLWHTFIWRQRHFCLEWQWHRWHYWHKLQTVDWEYKLSNYCSCSPQGPSGLRQTEAPHINRFYVFSCSYFLENIKLLVEETNRYYHQYLDALDEGWSHCLMWLFRKCVCSWQLLCRWGMVRGTRWKITGQH